MPEQPFFNPFGRKKKDQEPPAKPEVSISETSSEPEVSLEEKQALIIAKEIKDLKDKPDRTVEDDLLIIAKAKKIKELFHKEKTISIETAREIMQQDFLGHRAVEKAFGINLRPEQIPPIPFSRLELERAKELKEKLILRLPDYTIESLVELMKQKADTDQMKASGGLRFIADQTKNLYFTQDKTQLEWALVSSHELEHSYNKTAPVQLKLLVDNLEQVVYQNQPLPEKYQKPIKQFRDTYQEILPRLTQVTPQEFKAKSDQEIDNLIFERINNDSQRQELVNWLENQSITQLLTHSPAEWYYDFCLRYLNATTPQQKQQLQEDYTNYSRLSCRSSVVGLVIAGGLEAVGVVFVGWVPGYRHVLLGVSFSRH